MTDASFWRPAMAALFVCTASAPFTSAGEKVSLGPRPKAGDAWYVQLEQDIHQIIEQGDRTERVDITLLRGVLHKVKSVSARGAEIELSFDRVMQAITSSMITTRYDSDEGDSPNASPMFRQLLEPLLGQPMHMKLDQSMRPAEFHGMAEVARKIGDDPDKASNFFWPQMRQDYTDERALLLWGDSMYRLYPDRPVEVGEGWTREHTDKTKQQFGNVRYRYDCKLERVADEGGAKMAHVSFNGTVSRVPTSQPSTVDVSINALEGSFDGTAVFDIGRGLMIGHSEKLRMKVSRTMPPRGQRGEMTFIHDINMEQGIRIMSPEARAKEKNSALDRQAADRRKREAAAATQPAGNTRSPTTRPSRG